MAVAGKPAGQLAVRVGPGESCGIQWPRSEPAVANDLAGGGCHSSGLAQTEPASQVGRVVPDKEHASVGHNDESEATARLMVPFPWQGLLRTIVRRLTSASSIRAILRARPWCSIPMLGAFY